jgi:hypothetical protein
MDGSGGACETPPLAQRGMGGGSGSEPVVCRSSIPSTVASSRFSTRNELNDLPESPYPIGENLVVLNLLPYVVLGLYSRWVVARMVSRKENSALAQQLMQEAIDRYGVAFSQLTVHQDRGAPMTARSDLDLLAEFGVTCTRSRPRVSNDNPTSEAQFKTLKYQPDYPGRFENVDHARRSGRITTLSLNLPVQNRLPRSARGYSGEGGWISGL